MILVERGATDLTGRVITNEETVETFGEETIEIFGGEIGASDLIEWGITVMTHGRIGLKNNE